MGSLRPKDSLKTPQVSSELAQGDQFYGSLKKVSPAYFQRKGNRSCKQNKPKLCLYLALYMACPGGSHFFKAITWEIWGNKENNSPVIAVGKPSNMIFFMGVLHHF